jgi:malic enzyme
MDRWPSSGSYGFAFQPRRYGQWQAMCVFPVSINSKLIRCRSTPTPTTTTIPAYVRCLPLDTVAQTNNALIYPALGLGAILSRSRTISRSMLMAGVNSLASLSPALDNPEASLLPDLADVRSVSVAVAAAVVRQAVADGNAQDEMTMKVVRGETGQTLEEYIKVSGN